MRHLLSILLILTILPGWAQRITCSGIVTDAETGETLVNATVVLLADEFVGTTTDVNGFFSLPGIRTAYFKVEVQFIGYESKLVAVQTESNKSAFIEVELEPSNIEIGQIDVLGTDRDKLGDREVDISMHTLSPKLIKSIPTARNDVFKALRYLPGIEATEPLSPLVSVRGSDPGANMIMLDGVTIYNPYHFMSSSGIFNMQTVKKVDLLVGGFGAEYGGRNASVINISTKDGNQSGMHGEVRPSTSESKLFLEFPISDKTTMMLAGRLNYDLIGNFLLSSNNYFYDANLSMTHRFNAKNRLTVKYFSSYDKTNLDFNTMYRYMGASMGMEEYFRDMSLKWVNNWQNNIATVIYKSVLAPKVFLRAQASASLHQANNFSEMNLNVENVVFDTQTQFKSKVNDLGAKMSLNYKPFIWNELKLGAEYNAYYFANSSALNKLDNGSAEKSPILLAAFLEDKVALGPLTVRPGLRVTQFAGNDIRLEPRFNAALKLGRAFKLKGAYGVYNQYIVSMNTQEFELNQFLDYYYPLDQSAPSQSIHYIVGAEQQLNNKHTLSVDLYYKDIARTYTFDLLQDEADLFALSDKIVEGSGESYGLEMMWKGDFGRLSGWGSYTLSKSTRSFPHIMNGESYAYDYDRRHSFKAVLNYQASKRISYSASFIAQSGIPKSIETSLQMYYMYEPLTGDMIYSPQYTVDKKNASRMPWLFYLDFGLEKKVVSGFGKDLANFFGADESYLVVNVYNALFFRRNVLYYLTMAGFDRYLPMGDNYLPTVSAGYTIKF